MPAPKLISREAILATALRVADAEGVEALSMRRIARELGVEAMALYNHLPNKAAILDGIAEAAMNEVRVPVDPDDWAQAIRQGARAYREAARRHPRVFALVAGRPFGNRTGLAVVDGILKALLAAGLQAEDASRAFRILGAYLAGYTLMDVARLTRPTEPTNLEAYPAVKQVIGASASVDVDEVFDVGLNLLLDNLFESL